jgi:hypothetical protein
LPELKALGIDCTTFKMKTCSSELYSKAPLSLPVFAMLMLLFSETATTGAVGVIRPLTLAGVVLSLLEALLPWFIFASSEAEYATAAFVDEGNDDGRLALTPFPGGENKCASTSTDEEDEKVLSSSEEVDWR